MSSHEGVSCDACHKGNFTGNRYKCLICYDYDLCAQCHSVGAATPRHLASHPMQCILTHADYELFYGSDTGLEHLSQSFTCPLCGQLGFNEAQLQEHVNIAHSDSTAEVGCPLCVTYSGGDPYQIVDDLPAHLMLEHRAPAEFDRGVRTNRRSAHQARRIVESSQRPRRSNPSSAQVHGTTLTLLPPIDRTKVGGTNDRENVDPIAELLSQLSAARRSTTAAQSISSQLQQLELQLQSTRQQVDRLLPTQGETFRSTASISFPRQTNVTTSHTQPLISSVSKNTESTSKKKEFNTSKFLLSRLEVEAKSETALEAEDFAVAERSQFVAELLHASFSEMQKAEEQHEICQGSQDTDSTAITATTNNRKLACVRGSKVGGASVASAKGLLSESQTSALACGATAGIMSGSGRGSSALGGSSSRGGTGRGGRKSGENSEGSEDKYPLGQVKRKAPVGKIKSEQTSSSKRH